MKKTSEEQNEYLLLKIKTPQGHDFYEEHISIIDNYGYVDFAKFGKSALKADLLRKGDTIFIKESVVNGSALYAATFEAVIDRGEVFPEYYGEYESHSILWMRLSCIKKIESLDYLDDFETRAGGSVANALKSMSPNFYIHRK